MSSPSTSSAAGLATPLRFFPISKTDLSLPAVLKCGQAFRWTERRVSLVRRDRAEGEDDKKLELESDDEATEWCVGWKDRTVVLRQDDAGIHYRSLFPASATGTTAHALDSSLDTTLPLLRDYFLLDSARLSDLYAEFSERDARFKKVVESDGVGERVRGLRVCKQDEWEALVAFICSSNNNIARITLMLSRLCETYGTQLPSPPPGFTLPAAASPPSASPPLPVYAFPSPCTLAAEPVSQKLRELGFGYRAGYVASTAQLLCSIASTASSSGFWPSHDDDPDPPQPVDPALLASGELDPCEHLRRLGTLPYEKAHPLLLQFAGVGPKVADCVALFGLGIKDVVPVDVHVFQIAQRTYKLSGLPSSGAPSKAHYAKVQDFFRQLWGPWAGWAQQVVFAAELRTFKDSPSPKKRGYEDETTLSPVTVKTEAAYTPSAPPSSPTDSLTPSSTRRRGRVTVKTEVKAAKEVTPPALPTLATVPLSDSTAGGSAAERVKRRRSSTRA